MKWKSESSKLKHIGKPLGMLKSMNSHKSIRQKGVKINRICMINKDLNLKRN